MDKASAAGIYVQQAFTVWQLSLTTVCSLSPPYTARFEGDQDLPSWHSSKDVFCIGHSWSP